MSIFPTTVLLATDGSEDARLAVTTAVDLANSTSSELHIVFVKEVPHVSGAPSYWSGEPTGYPYTDEELEHELEQQARKKLDEEVERVRSAGGKVAEAHLRVGAAATEIVALAEDIGAGLIMIGSRGLGGIRRALMGSVSDAVVRHAHCPVMVVRLEK
jgi:nucleotide-binding universal stress UspA family protein